MNEVFEGELADQCKLVYVNNVIKGKLLVSETLARPYHLATAPKHNLSPFRRETSTELLRFAQTG